MSLSGKTLFITGSTRGIGLAIGMRAARDGANVVIVGKTDQPHPKLRGTVHEAAQAIEAVGGRALPIVADLRFEEQAAAAVERARKTFGGIDILVNNASAISLSSTEHTEMKRFDLMHQVNVRATFMASRLCLPALELAENPHVLMLSPPLSLKPQHFAPHLAYSLSKFGMSLCVLGLAEELRARRIAVNALWPRTIIATAAIENLLGGAEAVAHARTPEIVADAAHWIFSQPSTALSGQFLIDEEVLARAGVSDFTRYSVVPGASLVPDLFLDA